MLSTFQPVIQKVGEKIYIFDYFLPVPKLLARAVAKILFGDLF
jgi:hypothetical protein